MHISSLLLEFNLSIIACNLSMTGNGKDDDAMVLEACSTVRVAREAKLRGALLSVRSRLNSIPSFSKAAPRSPPPRRSRSSLACNSCRILKDFFTTARYFSLVTAASFSTSSLMPSNHIIANRQLSARNLNTSSSLFMTKR
ncbi:hypothetical protein I3843_13G127700 [Carya illinoinensis]|nr:hypothetical protein I3843_13G127700 [Carya illinoinensis]